MEAGDSYTKNGKTFTIQMIENGQVYGVMYREGFGYVEDFDGESPEGYLGNMRLEIADFEKSIEGATRIAATS